MHWLWVALIGLGVVSLVFAGTTLSGSTPSGIQDRNLNEAIQDRFVGAWRMA